MERSLTSGTMCFCIATWSVSSVKVWLNATWHWLNCSTQSNELKNSLPISPRIG